MNTNQELHSAFDAELQALQDEFTAQIKTIRACAYDSDVIINALDYMASAFELMTRDTRAMYTRTGSVGALWIEGLADVYGGYAAETFAVLHDTPCYKSLLPALKVADLGVDTLLQWAHNIEAFVNDYVAVAA